MKKIVAWLLPFIGAFVFIVAVQDAVLAVKPPWAGAPGGPKDQPADVPEPVVLTLIGMGASAAVGYYLGKRKKR